MTALYEQQLARREVATSHGTKAGHGPQLRESLRRDWILLPNATKTGLIPVRAVTLIVAHDVPIPGRVIPKLRLAGYSARVSRNGRVMWGGPHGHRLEKNLSLRPLPDAGGPRLDLRKPQVIDLGLRLARRIVYAQRYPAYSWRSEIEFPPVVEEFYDDSRCNSVSRDFKPSVDTLSVSRRDLTGTNRRQLIANGLPLDKAAARFGKSIDGYHIDLGALPRSQTIRLDHTASSLIGHAEGVVFDLLASRFDARLSRRSCRPQDPTRMLEKAASALL